MLDDVLDGAVDLYVHASPDLIPRRADDIGLAVELGRTTLRAAVHRHHFAMTADRARLATEASGFEMFGSILLNSAVGGINPAAVEIALRSGAVLVSLPTTSARYMQTRDSWARGIEGRLGLKGTYESFTVWDDSGSLLPAVLEIADLVAGYDAILALGYVGPDECLAAAQEASRRGVTKMLLTNPLVAMGLDIAQSLEITSVPGTFLEITAFALRPGHVGGSSDMDSVMVLAGQSDAELPTPDPGVPERQADLMRQVGVDRCVVSSDGGHAGEQSPAEELAWAGQALLGLGFSEAEVRVMVHDNPRTLLGLS